MLTLTPVQQTCTTWLTLLCTGATVRAATLFVCDPSHDTLRPIALGRHAGADFPTWSDALVRHAIPLPGMTPTVAAQGHAALHAAYVFGDAEDVQVLPLCEHDLLGYLVLALPLAALREREWVAESALATLLVGLYQQVAVAPANDLVDVLAHELRTPLLAAHLALQGAERLTAAASQTLHERVALARTSVGHAQQIVEDLVDDATGRARKLPVVHAPVDLVALAEDVVAAQRLLWPARIFTVTASTSPVMVQADPVRLWRVLENLLTNAVRYGDAATPILVRLQRQEVVARLTVTNGGPPIPLAEQPRLWDRFYQRPHTRDAGGLGLGLAIVRELIEGMAGQVGLHSTAATGTTFWVSVPLGDLIPAAMSAAPPYALMGTEESR